MKYTGKMYYRGYVKADGTITDAVIASKRISIDWLEDDTWVGHLDSESDDRTHFSGIATYQGSSSGEDHRFNLTLYRAGPEVLLFGTWQRVDKKEEGRWAFLLVPSEKCQGENPPGE